MNVYQEIFEHSFDGIYIVEITPDKRFKFIDANSSFLDHIGKSREMVVDTYLDEMSNEKHKEILTKKYLACIDAAHPIEFFNEFENLPSGNKLSKSILTPIKNDHGQIDRIAVIVNDVTENTKRDEQLFMADLALNIITDAVYLIDKQLQILYVNQAACNSLGYTKEEFLSKTPFDFDPALTTEMIKNLQGTIKNGSIYKFETKHQRKDGSVFDVEITTYPYKGDELGLHIVKDITDRKKAEDVIRLLTQAVDSSFDSIFLIQPPGTSFVYVNDAAARTLGYTKEELIGGIGIFDIDPYFTEEEMQKNIQSLNESKRVAFQTHHRTKDDRIYPVEIVINSIGDHYVLCIARDISAEIEANRTIEMLTNAINFLGDSVFLIDPKNGSFFYVNETAAKSLGYTKKELMGGMRVADIVPGFGEIDVHNEFVERLEQNADGIRFESIHQTKNGDLFPVEVHANLISLENQRYSLAIANDISEKKRVEEKLQLLASVFTHAKEGIVITDKEANIIDVNDAYLEIVGFDREELIGQNTRIVKSDKQEASFYEAMWKELITNKFWFGEVWNKRKNGELYIERLTISGINDANGEITHYVGLQSDITTLKDYEYRLEQMAFYDSLTGLANRVLLYERINHAISISKRLGTMIAVSYLDLDGFKPINDQYGHDIGDELLIEIGNRIKSSVRESDTVARIGGDEFVMLLLDIKNQRFCEETVEKILERINQPYHVSNGKKIQIGASVGIMVYPQDDSTPDLLLRRADHAMYLAKQSGKNKYVFYK